MRERALETGALTVVPTVEVTGLDVEDGRDPPRVRTDGGDIEAEARRHRLRRVEPQDRRHGRRQHPADPRRAPDDQRRPVPAAGRARGRDLVPDRARHGHVLLRAPARRRHGGRLLRAPRDPARAGGHPLDRAGQAVADRAAVHLRRLRPAARAGLRADARAARRRGRRDALRHQRPAVADLRRQPDPRREPGQGALDRRRGLDQGGSGRRPRGRRVDDRRPVRDRHRTTATSPGSTPTSCAASTPGCAPPSRSSRPTGSSTPSEQYESDRDQRLAPMHESAAEARARCSSRPPAGSGRTGTSPTPASSRSTATR